MKKRILNLEKINFDNTWTIFLDRDGVINKRLIGDYIKKIEEFEFIDGVEEAINIFNKIFGNIIVVTNQQGIGKGKMTHDDLSVIHQLMTNNVSNAGGKIDKIYYCPALSHTNHADRKPNIGMALKAKRDFKNINFKKSVMVGDSISDMKFGKRMKMLTIFISNNKETIAKNDYLIDFTFKDLISFAKKN